MSIGLYITFISLSLKELQGKIRSHGTETFIYEFVNTQEKTLRKESKLLYNMISNHNLNGALKPVIHPIRSVNSFIEKRLRHWKVV